MKAANQSLALSLVACCFLAAGAARAGTLINTNLPPDTFIVNMDATADGAANYSPDSFQSLWYQPINGVQLTVQAGTYTFRVVNPTDAAALYPNLTNAQLSQIYTGWTYNSPWSENYLVFNNTAAANPNEFQLFDGAIAPGNPASNTFSSAQAAYDGTIANGYYNKFRPAPPGRAGTAADYLTQYTFNTPTTLLFVIPDNILGDNTGGVSVVATQVGAAAVGPEPSTAMLLSGGAILLVSRLRRRTNRRNLPRSR